MGDSMHPTRFRFWLWLIRIVGVIVPRRLRADWRQEWEAELRHRETLLAGWDRLKWRGRIDLLWRSTSAFWDALWLQPKRWEDEMFQDLRYGLRMLLKHPCYTSVAIFTLALGIGANTAIFSVIDALLLKRLPVEQPEQLVTLATNYPGEGGARPGFVYQTFEQLRDRAPVFNGLAAVCLLNRFNVLINEPHGSVDAGQVRVGLVSDNYFSTLGVRAMVGRTITPGDDRPPDGRPVVVLSHAFWKRRLAQATDAASDAIGRTLTLYDTTYTIVGITPVGFAGEWVGQPADLWFPIAMQSQVMPEQPGLLSAPNSPTWVRIVGRLRPGVTVEQAQSSAQAVFSRWMEETFSIAAMQRMGRVQLVLEPAARGFSPERKFLARPLMIMFVLAGLVLLIVCANVANLLLQRATMRQREITMRLALGATPLRIVRQLLTESALLAVSGGVIGLLFAHWCANALARMAASGNQPLVLDLHLDVRMLLFASALCLMTGLLFGLAPAWRAAGTSLAPALKGSGTGAVHTRGRFRLSKALVVAQIALSLVLLVGAGLFVRTLRNLQGQDFGFDRHHVLLVRAAINQVGQIGQAHRQDEALARLYQTVRERISALSGVLAVGPSHGGIPPTGFMNGVFFDSAIRFVGEQAIEPGAEQRALWYVVAPGFFDALGLRLEAGRDFSDHDTREATRVAIINETMARQYFGNEYPIGKRFGLKRDMVFEVVGVVNAEKYNSPRDEDRLIFFLPYLQDPNARTARDEMLLAVRTQGRPGDLSGRIRQELRQIDAGLPIISITTMEEELGRALAHERLLALLAGSFGLVGLLLACIGVYGVMSCEVARRTQEIGIRMALGATAHNVVYLLLRETLALALSGAVLGLGAALVAARFIKSLLYGLPPSDPLTLGLAAVLLIVVAVLTSYMSARRAAHVDPLLTLRQE
jgi:predicted permease